MPNPLYSILKDVCERGLREEVYPGVLAAVSLLNNQTRYRACFCGGVTRSDYLGIQVNESTLFDLASLTKPLCTTLCTLHLIAAGKMEGNDSALSFFPNKPPGIKKTTTIHDILHHCSGLAAYHPYYKNIYPKPNREQTTILVQNILNESLYYPPGSRCLYSDLGFILLGKIIEHAANTTLDRLYREQITSPMNLADQLRFISTGSLSEEEKRIIAATEDCPWRKKIIQGEVHDEHCWLMGGVAGHAGLFGTATAVLRLCETLLDCWQERAKHPAFLNRDLRHALEYKRPGESWGLGFDRPTPGQSSSGHFFSPSSVGHLGFSGTSFWIDPEQRLIIVLLTNRIHPSRENILIRKFRPFFHDVIRERIARIYR